jgi:hypothetical protein
MNVYIDVATEMRSILVQWMYTHPDLSPSWLVFDIDYTLLKPNNAVDFLKTGNVVTPISPIVSILNEARSMGFKIAIITARESVAKRITIRNLIHIGVSGWDQICFKPALMSVSSFKSSMRRKIWENGGTIVTNVGDQGVDLEGGYALNTFKLPSSY